MLGLIFNYVYVRYVRTSVCAFGCQKRVLDPTNVSAGNQTVVFYKSSKSS